MHRIIIFLFSIICIEYDKIPNYMDLISFYSLRCSIVLKTSRMPSLFLSASFAEGLADASRNLSDDVGDERDIDPLDLRLASFRNILTEERNLRMISYL